MKLAVIVFASLKTDKTKKYPDFQALTKQIRLSFTVVRHLVRSSVNTGIFLHGVFNSNTVKYYLLA